MDSPSIARKRVKVRSVRIFGFFMGSYPEPRWLNPLIKSSYRACGVLSPSSLSEFLLLAMLTLYHNLLAYMGGLMFPLTL